MLLHKVNNINLYNQPNSSLSLSPTSEDNERGWFSDDSDDEAAFWVFLGLADLLGVDPAEFGVDARGVFDLESLAVAAGGDVTILIMFLPFEVFQ